MPVLQTSFPSLRENLSPALRRLPDRQIESVLAARGLDAEQAEGFFDDLKSAASSVGRAVVRAAPAVLPVAGTILGGAFGGPLGATLGGALGRAAGGAIGGGGGAVALPFFGGSAATQLLQTVARPETMRALMSMALGPAGQPSIAVGNTPVPVGAFSNLLGVLANRAAAEYNTAMAVSSEAVPLYMKDYAGEAVGDPAVPAQRADALYELLNQARSEQESESVERFETEVAEAMVSAEAGEAEAEAEVWEMLDMVDTFESE